MHDPPDESFPRLSLRIKKITRREVSGADGGKSFPGRPCWLVEPFYPKGVAAAHRAGLNVGFISWQWYGLADEAIEDAIYDSQAMRGFARIDLARRRRARCHTLLKFRRLLETNDLCKGIFQAINTDLAIRGLMMREGTLVDATLLAAPPSTKNKEKQRDPEMHQTRKGNQWYFGMKAHIGADRDSKLVHTVVVTAANVADITKTAELLHGQERQVHADARYTGVETRAEITALKRADRLADCRQTGQIKRRKKGGERAAQSHRESQGIRPGIRGASLPHHQEYFPASESALPGTDQKGASTPHALRTGQPGHRSETGRSVKNRADIPETG